MINLNFKKTGTLIKKLRMERNLTLQNVADEFGISKSAVSQWESINDSGICVDNLYKISKYFDVTVDELLNGKLIGETNDDYWLRNYNLSSDDFGAAINDGDIDKIKELFERCIGVKREFYKMVPLWAQGALPMGKEKIFYKLKEYFSFDCDYYRYCTGDLYISVDENRQKEFVNKIYGSVKNGEEIEIEWEMSKIYDFTFDMKKELICNSGNLKALQYMLDAMHQIDKDYILYINLKEDIGDNKENILEKLEVKPFYRVMLNYGCNCMLEYEKVSILDEDDLRFVDGNILETNMRLNDNIDNIGYFINYAGLEEHKIFRDWKEYSYKEYQNFIDYDKTELYKAVVNYKDSNPLKYYKVLSKQ